MCINNHNLLACVSCICGVNGVNSFSSLGVSEVEDRAIEERKIAIVFLHVLFQRFLSVQNNL